VIAALDLDRRVRRAGQAVAYLAVELPIAALGVFAVVALVLGAALSVVGVGLPLLLAAATACRWLVRLDRRAANGLLETHIPPLPGGLPGAGSPWRRSLDVLADRALWRMVAVLATKLLLIPVVLVVGLAPVLALAELLTLGVQGLGGLGGYDYLGPWSFGPGVGLVLCVLALPTAVLAVATLEALRTLLCTVTRALLAPRATPVGPVRELLAESLGDHSVAIAYWLPDRDVFVDEVGRPVELPEPGSGRAWTAVERDGRRVAAIVHDAALDTSRELVHAAAAASSLAIDNERLKADLRARVEELRVSRLRIVEATDATRRRIERDLHDGAQQQLVALALELHLLKSRVKDPDAGPLVDRLSERLATALAELRELARGIHPAILTQRGLGPAIDALADRGPVAIDADVDIDGRLPAQIEAAAYFVVAEALTNVAKYAQADSARVEIRQKGDEVLVAVSDDGVGGVDVDSGSGLRGLKDRLAAVDGTLTIDSPPGAGTRVEARLPCSAGRGSRRPAPEEVGA
jgi:signal transduction histidine kinase